MKSDAEKIKEIILALDFTECGEVTLSDIKFYDEIRTICEGDSCHCYNKSWACPPAVGTLSECREKLLSYSFGVLFSKTTKLSDSFDFEGMGAALKDFKKSCDKLYREIKPLGNKPLLLGNEGCARCAECTYPDSPCRFPEKLFPSIEGYGLNVSELAKLAGVRYNNGAATVTFFGMLLV